MIGLVLLFCSLAVLSWWAVGRLQSYLVNRSIVDTPNERSLHTGSVPRGGGLVITIIAILGFCVLALMGERPLTFFSLGLITAAWGALGWWDDKHDLSARLRFAVQFLIAGLALFLFGYVAELRLSTNLVVSLGLVGAVCSLLGIVWLTNLYNFMDGMDGLAASQSLVVAITLAFWALAAGDVSMAIACGVIGAATYGFLLRNWHPASIFLGDVGSITLGGLFSVLVVYFHSRYDIPVLSLVLLFGVFVADASVTLVRRLLRGERVWQAHRSHYYQRLAALGFAHQYIVLGYLVLMIVCAILASLSMLDHDRIIVYCASAILVMAMAMVIVERLEHTIQQKQ